MNKVFVTKQHETISLKTVRDSLLGFKSFSPENKLKTVKRLRNFLLDKRECTDVEYTTELFLRIIKIYRLCSK